MRARFISSFVNKFDSADAVECIFKVFSQTLMQVEQEASVFETQQQEMKQTRQLSRYALF